ncbi:MAG: amidohydrolase family protein [Gemmatimonadota bacterium]|nr:amidohydrolase family protein [Gemmatimonadota bacterium]
MSGLRIWRARWVLPIDAAPIRDGAVAVEGDRIAWVGKARVAPAGDRLDLGDALLLPALVNAHSHLDLTGFRGLLEGLSFVDWIRTLTAAKREVTTDDDLFDAARAGIAEGLRSGIGTFGDTADRPAAAQAMRALGVRGVAFQEVFGPDPAQAESAVADLERRVVRLLDEAGDEPSLVRIGVSPHAPYSVSDALYRATAALATARGWPLATHVAESADESALVTEAEGPFAEYLRGRGIAVAPRAASPVALLEATGVLATRPLLIHAVRCRRDDRERMRRAGAGVAHCPCSNAKLGHGVAPLREYVEDGLPVGLGSDSMASNNRMHLLEEARIAGLVQAARAGRAEAVPAAALLHLATLGGAQVLGLADEIGSLEPGKAADLAAFPLGDKVAAADLDPVAAAVYAMGDAPASWVMVAGVVRVSAGVVAGVPTDLPVRMAAQAARLAEWREARPAR